MTDPSGAAVNGAKVTVRNVRTNVTAETQTTDTGDWTVPLLDVGEYEVSVDSPGFKAETCSDCHR